MEKSSSFNYRTATTLDKELQYSWNGDFGLGAGDRRLAFSRQASFQQPQEPHTPISIHHNHSHNQSSAKPFLSRSVSSIDIPPGAHPEDEDNVKFFGVRKSSAEKLSVLLFVVSLFRVIRSGNRYMKRLFLLISLNVAYSTAELFIGLLTGRVGLVSDAFHLTFGCGLLTFSLFAMAVSREKPDGIYTYGYKRLEVLSAFTNALFLLFMSFSLAVEALHAFIEDESEHKHYLIVSAVTNLLVNLIGVWFFRNYARINLVYRKAEDMNYHSVCLHVLADSIRRVQNAEVLCLGLVSAAVFMLVMPLFMATGGILLQMAPRSVPPSALSKCSRQIAAREDVSEVSQARFWELVPGHVVGSLTMQVKKGMDDRSIFQFVHGLYHELGIRDLTVQVDNV
ncbi:hypothetical protein FEM48_Zijuj12G0085100 [Ziziphus jujuba var. spinosa]|uniref:Cation efflux protein transmembrane domain-containing protein n=1 Tax=Ziziphus jujuba var. spinosa TaxID=714518 RepID=A0A978UC90_ZIZJJ|nr:hypothetical protein FEM48_Zijuj12G0085100 [Ziziphus jujuba var. spinosa]